MEETILAWFELFQYKVTESNKNDTMKLKLIKK